MLNQDMRSDNPLRCGTYRGADQEAFEFFLGATGGLENVFYRIADTVKNADVKTTEFCLGARFSFTTLSRKLASKVQLPNGLDGFAGLVPRCTQQELSQPASSPPCSRKSTRRDSTSSTGYDVVFTVIVPAIGGDPWGRA
jgi:hypothetical protein